MKKLKKGLAAFMGLMLITATIFAGTGQRVAAGENVTVMVSATDCTVYYRLNKIDNTQTAWAAAGASFLFDNAEVSRVEVKVMPKANNYNVTTCTFNGSDFKNNLSAGGTVSYEADPNLASWTGGGPELNFPKDAGTATITAGTYTFSVTATEGSGNTQPGPMPKADITINGVTLTGVESGATITVPDNFDLNTINVTGATNWNDASYNGAVFVKNNDPAGTFMGPNYRVVNLEFDKAYFVNVTLVKAAFKGVGTNTFGIDKPDMFDAFTTTEYDLTQTSASNPGKIICYYDDQTITLGEHQGTSAIVDIQVRNLPAGAVTVDAATKKITVNSGYYASIPLTVTLADGTVGYLELNRVGIEIMSYKPGVVRPYQGGSHWGANFPTANFGNYNVAATFYHKNAESDTAYQLIAKLIYKDGRVETKTIDAYGGNQCQGDPMAGIVNSIRGSNYIVWSGDSEEAMPISVAITAVPNGSLSGSSFGGCTFGAGAGVEWKKQ